MSDAVVIRLDGEPRGKGRPRFGRNRAYTDDYTRSYERALGWQAKAAMGDRTPLTGPLKVRVYAEFGIPKSWPKAKREAAAAGKVWHTSTPDADNLAKCKDALNGIVWRDDSQVAMLTAWKRYGLDPHVKFVVTQLADVPEDAA